jgi:hypothetical protein
MDDDRTLLLAACDDACAAAGRDDARLAAVRPGSGWSPAQHLSHVALANGRILKAIVALARGRGTPRPGPPADGARAVLESGAIPRGTAQAPPGTGPGDVVDLAATRRLLDETRRGFAGLELSGVAADLARDHPALGPLTAAEWVRFAAVHTRHHVAIVAELLGSSD